MQRVRSRNKQGDEIRSAVKEINTLKGLNKRNKKFIKGNCKKMAIRSVATTDTLEGLEQPLIVLVRM